jgi:hypothetical protein
MIRSHQTYDSIRVVCLEYMDKTNISFEVETLTVRECREAYRMTDSRAVRPLEAVSASPSRHARKVNSVVR